MADSRSNIPAHGPQGAPAEQSQLHDTDPPGPCPSQSLHQSGPGATRTSGRAAVPGMEKLAEDHTSFKPPASGPHDLPRFPAGDSTSYRRPIPPAPLDPYEICHPAVPDALSGLTIAHVSDLHIRKGRGIPAAIRRLADALAATPVDLIALTGDYADKPKDTAAAVTALEFLASRWRTRFGAFATMGNHDPCEFRNAARAIPGIRWLTHETPRVQPIPHAPFYLWGFDEPEDFLGTILAQQTRDAQAGAPLSLRGPTDSPALGPGFHIALAHYPSEIYPAAEFGFAMILAGHTHGGQMRLSPSLVGHTSSDLPGSMAAGILRLRSTLALVSRGIGGTVVDWRVNCPPQAPVYTLRKGELRGESSNTLTNIKSW